MEPQKPKMYEVFIILIIFLVIMSLSVAVFSIPIQLGLFATWFIIIGLGLKLKHSYQDLQDSIMKGIYNGLEATLILFSVGALIGTWIAGGIVPSLIYYGLQILNPSIFLVAAMIICAITSLATGTSFGTAGTAGIAMMGIGASFGIPLPLVAGAVISGAYIGDKLSPLSDTTNLTASLSKVNVIEHVKGMLPVSIPTLIITGILFTIVGFFFINGDGDLSQAKSVEAALSDTFNIHWYVLIPAAVVIVLLTMSKPAIPVISFGALLGAVWAALFQGLSIVAALKTAYNGVVDISSGVEFIDSLLNSGGIVSMLGVIALILMALGLGGLLDQVGILRAFSNLFNNWVEDSTGRLTLSTMLSAFMGNLFGSAAYVSNITGTKMTEDLYDDRNIDRRVLSRNTEGGGTVTTPMVPWSDGGIYMSTVLGVSTLSYLPFLWFSYVGIIITILYGYMGWFFFNKDKKKEKTDQESA